MGFPIKRATDRVAKGLTTRAIRTAFSALPRNALDTVLDELRLVLGSDLCRRRSRFRLLSRLAVDSGVVALSVDGDYGVIQSAASDAHILFRYSEERRFADRTNKLIAEFFRDGAGSYIDVGANIGMTVIPIARNPLVQCLAFEPEPTNFANLVANVATNCPHRNVVTEQIALFSHADRLTLELAPENLGDHRVRTSNAPGYWREQKRHTIEVQARPLDSAVGALQLPLAIKIDTQGAEPYVFGGGPKRDRTRGDSSYPSFGPTAWIEWEATFEQMLDLLIASFATIAIAEFEEGEAGAPIAVASACEWLAERQRQHVADPEWYCDIIAYK